MGVHISLYDFQRASRFLTRPGSIVSASRFERTIEKELFGQSIQFIFKYTDPERFLVIVGERLIKKLLGL